MSASEGDKTGTLTQNVMTVSHLATDGAVTSTGALANSPYPEPDPQSHTFRELLNLAFPLEAEPSSTCSPLSYSVSLVQVCLGASYFF
jgi:magnesium-transporting ATPase (P-type)